MPYNFGETNIGKGWAPASQPQSPVGDILNIASVGKGFYDKQREERASYYKRALDSFDPKDAGKYWPSVQNKIIEAKDAAIQKIGKVYTDKKLKNVLGAPNKEGEIKINEILGELKSTTADYVSRINRVKEEQQTGLKMADDYDPVESEIRYQHYIKTGEIPDTGLIAYKPIDVDSWVAANVVEAIKQAEEINGVESIEEQAGDDKIITKNRVPNVDVSKAEADAVNEVKERPRFREAMRLDMQENFNRFPIMAATITKVNSLEKSIGGDVDVEAMWAALRTRNALQEKLDEQGGYSQATDTDVRYPQRKTEPSYGFSEDKLSTKKGDYMYEQKEIPGGHFYENYVNLSSDNRYVRTDELQGDAFKLNEDGTREKVKLDDTRFEIGGFSVEDNAILIAKERRDRRGYDWYEIPAENNMSLLKYWGVNEIPEATKERGEYYTPPIDKIEAEAEEMTNSQVGKKPKYTFTGKKLKNWEDTFEKNLSELKKKYGVTEEKKQEKTQEKKQEQVEEDINFDEFKRD